MIIQTMNILMLLLYSRCVIMKNFVKLKKYEHGVGVMPPPPIMHKQSMYGILTYHSHSAFVCERQTLGLVVLQTA